jgi:tetratricopeptide (TPR) repeat protein
MKNRVEDVFNILMENSSVHDWNVIKHVRGILSGNQKQQVVDQLDGIIKESNQLRLTINELLENKNVIEFTEALTLISFYSDLNALDQAKQYYTRFIEEAEKRNDQNSLVVALEQLGASEYKRSGHDGYKAAMAVLTRAAEIRESEATPQKDKLENTYRLLGFAYLSLGLQVVKSTEYFEMAKAIILEESTDSAELAEINLYIGLVNFWRGLRGVGRWGHADPSLLEGLDVDLFEYADAQFQQAFNYMSKHLGKTHPQTFKTLHYLQENRYAMGNYERAILWLRKYVEALPFKSKEHTDNFYRYCLVVSLEEHAKQLALTDPQNALGIIQDAFKYIQNYDEGGEIGSRLNNVKSQIEAGKIEEPVYPNIDELPTLEIETRYKGFWSKWQFSDELKGFQTNNWMVVENGVWFFNGEKKQLVFWDHENNTLTMFHSTHWPEGCGRMVYDQKKRIFYAWSSIRSTVYELTTPDGSWSRLSFGVHDVHACGASYAFDPINNRLFEFGGYGYFTYKNWLWVYDISDRKWIQLKENKPGISPYPRNGQLLPIENGAKSILMSGIGSDTGIQREHKARLGLANATDVGYFTWLRDAYELDLATMEWKTSLPANHESIQHEGAMGFVEGLNLIVNWAGIIPSPIFGQEAIVSNVMSCWHHGYEHSFKQMHHEGSIVPSGGGYFVTVQISYYLLYFLNNEIYKLEIR